MPLSKVIKPGLEERYRIESFSFEELDGPLPEPALRADSFKAAGYFRDRTVPRKDNFAPSFGPKDKKTKPDEKPAPPLTPEQVAEKAQAEAAALLEATRAEAEAFREKAREEGRAEGLEAGQEELEALKLEAGQRLMEAVAAVENLRGQVIAELEGELVELVVTAASKVVAREIRTDPGVVASVVAEALKLVSGSRWIKIRLNPEDVELIEPLRTEIEKDYPDLAKVDLIADEAVARGGCLAVTESEEIDDTVETRLENMAQAMDRVLQGLGHGN